MGGTRAFQVRHAHVVVLCVETCSNIEVERCNAVAASIHHASALPVVLLYKGGDHHRALFAAAAADAAAYIHWLGARSAVELYRTVARLAFGYCGCFLFLDSPFTPITVNFPFANPKRVAIMQDALKTNCCHCWTMLTGHGQRYAVAEFYCCVEIVNLFMVGKWRRCTRHTVSFRRCG